MMFSAIEAMANAYSIRLARRYNSDFAAEATTCELFQGSPPGSTNYTRGCALSAHRRNNHQTSPAEKLAIKVSMAQTIKNPDAVFAHGIPPTFIPSNPVTKAIGKKITDTTDKTSMIVF